VRVLCCPDKLKGVLSAPEATAALAEGVSRAGHDAVELPLADGGEGTGEAIAAAQGGSWHTARVSDALGRRVEARFLLLPGGRAVVESAQAVGLWRLAPSELDPIGASSAGLGELLLAAVDAGATEILVTLGGSATVDGGEGMRRALSVRGLDGVRLRAACDVTNPLLGPRGAARVFGPQKGASREQVVELEGRLAGMKEIAPYAELPGAGAAGGLGAAMAALGAELVSGIDLVLEAAGFRDRLAGCALAITGEGQVDEGSASGKVPAGVAAGCAAAGVPCVVFGGRVRGGTSALYALGATAIFALSGRREHARQDLEVLGEALARLVAAVGESR
jgi:glycerate kinase